MFLPLAAYAATPRNFADLVDELLLIFELAVHLIFGLTLIVFIWGLISGWILNAGSEAGADRGKNMAIAGIIGLIVMTGLWGIISLAQTFNEF